MRQPRALQMSTSPFETANFQNNPSGEKPASEMDQLRDLLLGDQMRKFEDRFRQTEVTLRGNLEMIRADFERQLGERLNKMREELATISSKLTTQVTTAVEEVAREASHRKMELGNLTDQTKEGFTNVQVALASADERQKEMEKQLQKSISDKTRFMHDELQASIKSMTSYLDAQTRELRDNKLDKDDLSKALQFVAGGLAPKPQQKPDSARGGRFPA